MKKMPTLYRHSKKGNNQVSCYVTRKETIDEEIKKALFFLGPISEKKVWVKTKEKEFITYIAKTTDKELITIQNETIPICDIVSIKRIS